MLCAERLGQPHLQTIRGIQGLLARQLQFAGGILIGSRPEVWDARHCRGPCNKTFPTLQSWGVHALKVHGCHATGRGVLSGKRCECCLRQFSTNLKLCKHLAHNADCRHRLQAAGYWCQVEPGQGSTRAEDAGKCHMLVVRAMAPCFPSVLQDGLTSPIAPSLRSSRLLIMWPLMAGGF